MWLSRLCCDPEFAGDIAILAELCEVAAQRFCGHYCDAKNMRVGDRPLPEINTPLQAFLQGLLATDQTSLATKLIASIRMLPQRFTIREVQIPCLSKLIPWTLKRLTHVHPVLAEWHQAVRMELIAATSKKPQLPTNWARPAKIATWSRYAEPLNKFLADPASETLALPASAYERDEIIRTVKTHQCDVTHRWERIKNRYQLVFTKTLDSYERALKQHADDLKLLATLEAIPS